MAVTTGTNGGAIAKIGGIPVMDPAVSRANSNLHLTRASDGREWVEAVLISLLDNWEL